MEPKYKLEAPASEFSRFYREFTRWRFELVSGGGMEPKYKLEAPASEFSRFYREFTRWRFELVINSHLAVYSVPLWS
ncbi:hypothetical protein BSF38_04575 [Paludisphaera borealis]|uniref:Uncharacterized protein n=1 Tax=Paludisphaera borealis TaxID=1387353 RepID=A0A1U7CVP1_9BACT|nr:hypothetical protein BSF38_04575 [Paludisphaera borealis]